MSRMASTPALMRSTTPSLPRRQFDGRAAQIADPLLQANVRDAVGRSPSRKRWRRRGRSRDRSAATFQPTSANSRPSATSLTIGAAIRNENVTPSGTPALTKPMNSGTAEQEQNGVTTPRLAAATLPNALAPSGEQRAGAFRREETAHDAHAENDKRQQQQHFRRVVEEEGGRLAESSTRDRSADG